MLALCRYKCYVDYVTLQCVQKSGKVSTIPKPPPPPGSNNNLKKSKTEATTDADEDYGLDGLFDKPATSTPVVPTVVEHPSIVRIFKEKF